MMLIMRLLAFLLFATASFAADSLYFPPNQDAGWERMQPAKASWDAAALNKALDFAGSRRSTAVVVSYKGKIMAERQWDPEKQKLSARFAFERSPDGQILEDVASAQKSVAAVLFGIAQHKGLIRIDDPVQKYLGAGWSKATPEQEKKITMRHLLTMTSGLTDGLAFEAEPGTKWRYNTMAYQKTMRALAKAAAKPENELTREWLTGPIGMSLSHWQERPQMPGLLGFVTSARQMARFGLLIQAGGVWDGKTIVADTAYLRQMLEPSQKMNEGYGYLWWLNGHEALRPGGARVPKLTASAPDDMVAALGALGRKVYVVRSLGLVVTRTGDNSDQKGEPPFDNEFWKALMKAAPVKAAARR
jgi:CubicO group peptidase (beta-lactamase class C family)